MRLRVVIGAQDAKGNTFSTSAYCETDADETIDRREMLLALGDQARLQFDIVRGREEEQL